MLERLSRGLTFIAGSVVGGLALAFVIVAAAAGSHPRATPGSQPAPASSPAPAEERARRAAGRRASRMRRPCSAQPPP